MNTSLIEKIKLLSDLKMQTQIYKIIPTLMEISVDNIKDNQKILKDNGITIKHIYEVKVYALKTEELSKRLAYAKEHNTLSKFIKKPLLIMDEREFKNKKAAPIISKIGFRFPSETKKEEAQIDITDASAIIDSAGFNLTSSNFDRYQLLGEAINNIAGRITDFVVTKDPSVFEALSKLVAANYGNDRDSIYQALTQNKDYTDEQLEEIKKAIDDELSILNKIGVGE